MGKQIIIRELSALNDLATFWKNSVETVQAAPALLFQPLYGLPLLLLHPGD